MPSSPRHERSRLRKDRSVASISSRRAKQRVNSALDTLVAAHALLKSGVPTEGVVLRRGWRCGRIAMLIERSAGIGITGIAAIVIADTITFGSRRHGEHRCCTGSEQC